MEPSKFWAVEARFYEYLELITQYLALTPDTSVFRLFIVGWSLNHAVAEQPPSSSWLRQGLWSGLRNGFQLYVNQHSTTPAVPPQTRENVREQATVIFGMALPPTADYDWQFFDNHMATAAKELLLHRDDLWLRHGYEEYDYLKANYSTYPFSPTTNYPTYFKENVPGGYWAVEIGRAPFTTHMLCWQPPLGMLALSRYKPGRHGRTIVPCKNHYACCGTVPISDWLFLVNPDTRTERWTPLSSALGVLSVRTANRLVEIRDRLETAIKVCASQAMLI